MTSLRDREFARLCLAALDRGELEIRGDKFFAGGRQVLPQLAYEVDADPDLEPALERARLEGRRPAPGIRLGEQTMAKPKPQQFASLPRAKLAGPGKGAEAERSRLAAAALPKARRAAVARFVWPRSAPLPEARLTRDAK